MAKKKYKKFKHFKDHLGELEGFGDIAAGSVDHETWSPYATVLAMIETLAEAKTQSAKVARRRRKSIKQIRKLALHAMGPQAVCPPNGGKKKKSGRKKPVLEAIEQVSAVAAAANSEPVEREAARSLSAATRAPGAMDAPREGGADDLKLISGVGPKLEIVLNDLGIFHFEQIAAWQEADIRWVDEHLSFPGRIERENWIEQAAALAAGGPDEYIRRFGREPI